MLPAVKRIFVYAEPADMRRSFDALSQCVREMLKQDPASGALILTLPATALMAAALAYMRCVLRRR